jgi:hypothetical protein
MGTLRKTFAILLAAGLLGLLLHVHPAPRGEGMERFERDCVVCASAGRGVEHPEAPPVLQAPEAGRLEALLPEVSRPDSDLRRVPASRGPPA